MARNSARSGDPIDRLLQERQQYTVWLSRLDATSDTAPESVRTRVRADYQARLNQVIEELRGHADDLKQQLERHRDSRGELLTREEQAKEILAEAEVRHAVGEYGDSKWQQIRGEAQRNLVTIREDLAKVNEEIDELEKVQGMIAGPVVAEPEAPQAAAPAPEREPAAPPEPPPAAAPPEPAQQPYVPPRITEDFPELAQAFEEVTRTPPPRAEEAPPAPAPGQTTVRPAAANRPPKPREGAPAGRTLWFPSGKDEAAKNVDELAFLKSVSEDETTGPSPRRASGGNPRPAEAMSPPTPPPPIPPPLTTAQHTLEPSGPHPEMNPRPSVPTGQRTLKCGECGTMNRPTEWYCERCGAELADL